MTASRHRVRGSRTRPKWLDALILAARGGDGRASLRLAELYREGEEVQQDWDEAFRWNSLGASQGEARAQNDLATMLLGGVGCAVDEERAAFWYRRSAEQGYATAQANLARRYLRGEGVAPDLAEAFRWFRAAASQGDLASTCALGTMYQFGRGVERDVVAAARFHLAAAKRNLAAAESSLRDYVEELQDAALSGSWAASWLLADMHLAGIAVRENPALTWTWINWARERCEPSPDQADAAAVETTLAFHEEWLGEEARAEGERVLASLLQPLPPGLASRARPRLPVEGGREAGSRGSAASA